MRDTFGERLRKFRKENGLSQGELAKKIGILQQQLCRYEAER